MSSSQHSYHVPKIFNWDMVRAALRAGDEGVYCWDINDDEIFYTEQCLRMMGADFDKHAPNIFTEPEITIHPDDLNFFKSELKIYFERVGSIPLRLEVRLLSQTSRSWKWVRINGVLEYDKKARPKRLIGIWVDITRRKMSERNAMEDRNLFRRLIDFLPDNIYFKNKQSRFVMTNDATARKMGLATPADIIGRSDADFFDESMSAVARREELEIMETGRPITSRIHKETWKGKQTTWSQISKFPWRNTEGNITGILGISSDVTKLVEAELNAQKLAATIDRRNQELEGELKLARDIQLALIPHQIPSCTYTQKRKDGSKLLRRAKFHHIYRPSAAVSGDCFEVYPVGKTGVGMLICDVMGHDVSAALISSMLRGIMGQVSNLADTPALLLSSLNQKLCKLFTQSQLNMFSSACYVYLDLEKSRLTLSSAGHPAPIVIGVEGKAFLPPIPRSPALGLRATLSFRESEISFVPGMKLMLYTDGLTEASNAAGDEMGATRLMDHLNNACPKGIVGMLDECLTGMKNFMGGLPQSDDICLLGVEFEEEDA